MNKTVQATKHIINYIENRQLKKNDPLPTLREIAATCGVSIFIAKKAIENLKEFNIVNSKWGSGNFIEDCSKENLKKAVGSLNKPHNKLKDVIDTNSYIAFIGKGRNPAFYGGYLTGIYDIAIKENYLMVLEMSNHSTINEMEIVKRLAENKSIKGIIIGPVNKSQPPPYLQLLQHRNIPYVFVGDCNFGDDCQATYVKCDNYAGFMETMNHLYEMGHRNIAYVGTPRYDLPANQER